MQGGKLNRWIDIQQPLILNGLQRWQTLAHVPAQIESGSGSETARAGLEPLNVFSSTITIRYRSDVQPKMRILFGTRIFEIVSVSDPDASLRQLNINVRETQT